MGIREILTVLFVSLGLLLRDGLCHRHHKTKDFLSYLQIAGVGSGAAFCCAAADC